MNDLITVISKTEKVMKELSGLDEFEELQINITLCSDMSGVIDYILPQQNHNDILYSIDLPVTFNLTKERIVSEVIQGYNRKYG